MGSLRLLVILFVAIEFTSTLAYNYGDPISVRIKYQYNEETTDWFDLPYEKVPLFKKHGSLVIQPSLSISISKYTPLKAMLSFSDHNVQSEWFIIQDGVGNYIQTLNMKLKVSNKELTSLSIVPIYYNEPFSGSKPLPDLFTIKYYWELSNEVYEDQSYLYFVWITIILVLTYVLLFFIVKPVHQYDDSSNTIQSPSEFNKSNASFGSMNSLGGKKGSFSGPLSTSGSTGMTSAVYRNNRLKAD